LYANDFSFARIRQANTNTEGIIKQQIVEEPQQTVQIIRELIQTILNGPKQTYFRSEELIEIKRQLYNQDTLAKGITGIQQLLMKAYENEKDFKSFAYLQQFYMRFF